MTISAAHHAPHVMAFTIPTAQPVQEARRESAIREIVRDVRDGIRDGMRADQSANAASNAQAAAAQEVEAAQNAQAQAEEAAAAAREAAAAQGTGSPNREVGGDFTVRVGPDGLLLVQTQTDGTETVTPWDAANIIPPQVTDIMLIGVLGLIGIIMAFPIGRAIARWIDRRGAAGSVPNDVARRLAAIEDSVQAVAVEVERLSESNRYTARLLTERVTAPDFRAGDAREPGEQREAREVREASSESASPRSTWQAS